MKPLRYLIASFRELRHARTEWERKEMLRLIAMGMTLQQQERTTQPRGAADRGALDETAEPETVVESRPPESQKPLSGLARRILERWTGETMTSRAIARACGVAESGTLREAIKELLDSGKISRAAKGLYRLENF